MKIGSENYKVLSVEYLADWPKIQRFDWGALNWGFETLGVLHCDRTPRGSLKQTVTLDVKLDTSALSPLGRRMPQAETDRWARLSKRSGFKNKSEMMADIAQRFPPITVNVPTSTLISKASQNYRVVVGYIRQDNFAILYPSRNNPHDDFMWIGIPSRITWKYILVGICEAAPSEIPDVTGPRTYRKFKHAFFGSAFLPETRVGAIQNDKKYFDLRTAEGQRLEAKRAFRKSLGWGSWIPEHRKDDRPEFGVTSPRKGIITTYIGKKHG